jgi:hypothetical protein
MQHLVKSHKFQECNRSKIFFRADHFRQHLKHSHSATSGKWTNHLENACMVTEGEIGQDSSRAPDAFQERILKGDFYMDE